MFISWQTYEEIDIEIEITVNSLILLAKFLIQHKKSYILTVNYAKILHRGSLVDKDLCRSKRQTNMV